MALLFCALLASCVRSGAGSGRYGANPWTIHGVLRIAGRQQPDSLNPLLGTQTVDRDLSMFWAAYLFVWNDRDEFVPELATRVPTQRNGDISPDGLRIRYHLRHGVVWQDGAPFTADDVVYTWHQMLNPRNFIVSRFGYDLIRTIAQPDHYTVDVHLKRRFSPFVATFFTMSNQTDCILPKHLLDRYPDINRAAYNGLPIGTGPFRMVSYERGSRITFVANPRYWRGTPRLRRIEWHLVESDDTMLTMLQTHAIDVYYRAAETLFPSLQHIPGTRVVLSPFTRFADLGFNGATPALADVRVRRALAYATDRAALIDKVTHGVAVRGDSDQPPFSWAFDPSVRKYPYDPGEAAALLDAAGWRRSADGMRRKNGRALALELVSFTGSATASEAEVLLQDEWHRAGIEVTIKNYSSAQLYATLGNGGIEQSGKFDVIFENWANGTDPDDTILFRCDMEPPAGWNVYHFCNARLDAAAAAALKTYDQSSRKQQYGIVQRIVASDLPILVLWYQRQLDVINTDFQNYKPAHAVTPFWNTWEWSI